MPPPLPRRQALLVLALSLPLSALAQKQRAIPANPKPSKAMVALIAKAIALRKAGKFAEAVALLEPQWKALPKATTIDDRTALAHALADAQFAWASDAKERSAWQEAIQHYQNAYQIDKTYRIFYAAADLVQIGLIYNSLGEKAKALEFYNKALPLLRQVDNKVGVAYTLNNIGAVYSGLGDKTKALEFFNQALPLLRQVGDKQGEATTLAGIGLVYNSLGENSKALEYYNQALPIQRKIGDKLGEAIVLGNIGKVYSGLGEKVKALEFYNQGLPIERQVGDKRGEANTLTNIGAVYDSLGEKAKALEFLNQALTIDRQVDNKEGEATTLTNIGAVYNSLGEKAKALEFLNQALPIRRQIGDKRGEAETLNNIGAVYSGLGEKVKALEFYNMALLIRRQIGGKEGEAHTLNNIGAVYDSLGEKAKALKFLNLALPIFRQVGDKEGEASTLNNLMVLYDDSKFPQRSPEMAALYGKQSVNLYQSMRADINSLDKGIQATFTKSVEGTYQTLADILIEQGRILEAQQVLDLLKQQELFDFLRRDSKELSTAQLASLNALEAEADKRMREQGDKLIEIAGKADGIRRKTAALRTAEEKAELVRLEAQERAASAAFQKVLDSLVALFTEQAQRVALKKIDLRETEGLSTTLTQLRQQTQRRPLAIYTLAGENKLRFLIVTEQGTNTAREYPITAAALSKKVAAFREALQNPRVDPRSLAKELYDIVIGPIEKDLSDANADTVMWSLDGALRYIPLATLSPDGKRYLIETERQHVVLTPASLQTSNLTREGKPRWQALALGVSQEHTVGTLHFDALGGAKTEVQEVARLLPGSVSLLDKDFTRNRLESTLLDQPNGFPVVHIASHFHFPAAAKTDADSFLLLGDGTALSLADFKTLRSNLFAGVEVLALSACNTANGSGVGDTGAEVEGLAVVAQRKGASAVIASLWAVSDASTAALMERFYQLRQSAPPLTKAECLRRAQLALLRGEVTLDASTLRGIIPVNAPSPKTPSALPAFTPPTNAPAAHPFYWAAFVLMGNWK